jgi:excisionase family DNA binding protein
MDDEILSPREVSKELKVSRPLPYQWVKRGLIEYYKIGKTIRFRRSFLEKFLEEHRVK